VYFYLSYPDILVQFQMIHKNATVHRPSKNKYDEKLNLSAKYLYSDCLNLPGKVNSLSHYAIIIDIPHQHIYYYFLTISFH